MTTVINTPAGNGGSGGSMGMILGLIVLVVVVILFFVYGLPAIQNARVGSVTPQINVPSSIAVNVKKSY